MNTREQTIVSRPQSHGKDSARARKTSWALLSIALMCGSANTALSQTISTVAGNGTTGTPIDGSIATAAPLRGSKTIAAIPGGGFYIGDTGALRKVDANGKISTLANATTTYTLVDGLALAADGVLYYAEDTHYLIHKRASDGITTLATSAFIDTPAGMALDDAGNLYIVEGWGCRVRKLDSLGVISTVMGSHGNCTSSGDGGPAISATLNKPGGIAIDRTTGSIYISERWGNRIRKIAPDGIVTTIAGNGMGSSTGDGGQAISATLNYPNHMDIDAQGNLYVAETFGYRVRRITKDGVIITVAGNGNPWRSGDGGPALSAGIGSPSAVSVAEGGYYIAQGSYVRFVSDPLVQPQEATSCATEGYTGTKLLWCQKICESDLSGKQLEAWLQRWTSRYRDLPYCARKD